MIYFALNFVIAASFVILTFLVDKKIKVDRTETNFLLVPLLTMCVSSILFLLNMLFKNMWFDSLISQLLKLNILLDAIFIIMLSTGFISYAIKRKPLFIKVLQIILIVLAFICIYFVFNRNLPKENVHFDKGWNVLVNSSYLFIGELRTVLPWKSYNIYIFFFYYFVPFVCYLFFVLLQEKSSSPIQRFQGFLMGEGILLMWAIRIFISFVSKANPSFECFIRIAYLFMLIIIVMAIQKTTIPSGRTIFVNLIKILFSYLIPAFIVGFASAMLQPVNGVISPKFIILFILIAIAAVSFAIAVGQFFASSSRMYNSDYGKALEKELASIDYNDEMDLITNRMYEIFRKNVEASSVNVYILGNKGVLETAYSSNGLQLTIPVNTPVFDELLNINKSVVIFTEIGNKHEISVIDEPLTKFFETTKSDAMFILNEGRNILGLITLGKKISGDHYKEYDYNIFTNLYSYFFVFGYYMRNIANREIISIVNREIKMSSQIITSIQENIDHIKTDKVDTGYMMVPAHNIGGEFIDMIRLTDTRHLFVVGDLSGKGIAASMNMVILKSVIRTYLAEIHDFKELVVKINTFIRESFRKGTIFAGLFALIDFETDTMYYINCGIPALMLYTQVYNNVIEIQGSGHILGFVKDLTPFVSVKTTKLNKGDVILACTDGLVQSHSLRGEQFGKERIQQCVLDNSTYPAQRMAQFTFESLTKFMQKEMEDDVSILVLKYGVSSYEETPVQEEEVPAPEPEPAADEIDPAEMEADENEIAKEFMDSQLNAVGEEVVEGASIEDFTKNAPNALADSSIPGEADNAFNVEPTSMPEAESIEDFAFDPENLDLDDMFVNSADENMKKEE